MAARCNAHIDRHTSDRFSNARTCTHDKLKSVQPNRVIRFNAMKVQRIMNSATRDVVCQSWSKRSNAVGRVGLCKPQSHACPCKTKWLNRM